MRGTRRTRSCAAVLMAFVLLAAPTAALAKKGEKNYKRGLQAEQAQQWEKAAQEYALAVAASPSDTEYQLHYRRAVFNASQVYMQKGRSLAEQGDYVGAYNAFRTAYGYDPVNLLAASEMERMLRLQREKEGLPALDETDVQSDPTRPRTTPEAPRPAAGAPSGSRVAASAAADEAQISERTQPLRQINYNGDLEDFIRQMTNELNLNVVFDAQFAQTKRNIKVQLKGVTAAQALDYIFRAHGLFFQKLSRRTILVADQSKRPQYQELVLRTFYLSNIDPNDARQLIQAALPANAGRTPQVVTNKATNSITVRDTPENVRIIGDLLKSVDKDRAEVVMEVSIYEVSRTDLLQIGNQFGTVDSLTTLGGLQPASILFEGARRIATGTAGVTVPVSTGVGLLIPASSLSLLQSKDNTRLVFSTQVHAFDDEKSETRIGAKVPVQTASVTPFGGFSTPTQGTGTGTGTATPGVFSGNGFPVIQYEDTGLSLDFTPKVFPNQDVQVKMVIETKDTSTTGSGAASALTPTFTQRRITGTARVPNGKTMMIASIAQDRESNGRAGLPLLGLIPIFGRLFTAPRKNNIQSDVVITMTPRVLRAPVISPRDEETKPSGSMQTPAAETLEAMVRDADREDQLAELRQRKANAAAAAAQAPATQPQQVAAPPTTQTALQTSPAEDFVPAPKALAEGASAPATNGSAANVMTKETAADAKTTPVVLPAVSESAPPASAPATNATATNG
ncbi:MAG TPA: secretin N-terminal domain-containing protein, partial [Pyrinomonadaceae bacterium]|nr:secretin N-terminal domain-containing protein [Pyrinomonadaceae bacterium]